jgi:hypothetical protein
MGLRHAARASTVTPRNTRMHIRGTRSRSTRIAECLAQIQNRVSVLLKMPAEIIKDQALAVIEAATLLSGDTQTGTVNGTINIVRHEDRFT